MTTVLASSPRTARRWGVNAILTSAPSTPLAISLFAPQCRNSLICAQFVAPSMSMYLNCLLLPPCSPSHPPRNEVFLSTRLAKASHACILFVLVDSSLIKFRIGACKQPLHYRFSVVNTCCVPICTKICHRNPRFTPPWLQVSPSGFDRGDQSSIFGLSQYCQLASYSI
jgi:hypothetical protein